MIPLSFSSYRDSECPHRFKVLKIDKSYKEPEGEALKIGAHVAEILKTYRLYCFSKKVESDLAYLRNITSFKTSDKQLLPKITGFIEAFANSPYVIIPIDAEWYRIESKLAYDAGLIPLDEKQGWFDKKAAFRMVSDFAYVRDGVMYCIDDKTGRGESDELQMKIYSTLLPTAYHYSFGGDAPQLERVVCVFNELGKGRQDVMEYDIGVNEPVMARIMERQQEIDKWTEFPAIACSKCKWCSVPGCTLKQDVEALIMNDPNIPVLTIPREIQDAHMAGLAVKFLMFGQEIVDQVEDALKEWVEKNGPVVYGGKIAEIRPGSDSWKAKDLQAACKALVAYGAPLDVLWANLSLTKSALEKICKRPPLKDRLPMLLAMGESKTGSPRFGLYNHNPDKIV